MTRFNFVSETADGMGFALQMLREGNEVRMWIHDPDAAAVGDGLVPKVGDVEDLVHDADNFNDIFIFDTSGNGVLADGLRYRGFAVLGGSVLADRLEKDRKFAREVMKQAGIKTPPTFQFKSFEDGIEFATGSTERMVYKPSKRLGEISPSLVTYDREDLVELLEGLKSRISMANIEFDLQTFVKGLEISTEGWFDGNRWLPLFNHTFERKQLMPGNLGPSGGCTGNVVWSCNGECPVCKFGLRKLEKFLRSNSFEGMIDLNAIVAPDGLYGLEFTPRFGYDASPTLLSCLLDEPLGDTFAAIARHQTIPEGTFADGKLAAAVKITIPPWPTEKHHADCDVPIRGWPNDDWVYWYNVKKGERTAPFVSAGAWGIICLTLGVGSSVKSAFKRPYEMAESLRLQDKQYRLDLVDQFEENMEDLDGVLKHLG